MAVMDRKTAAPRRVKRISRWGRCAGAVVAAVLWCISSLEAQSVSCSLETSGSNTNYVCTISDCTSFDLNTLNGLVGADSASIIWIRAWGGAGGKGSGVADADGGDGGDGGYAQTVTTVADYYDSFGTTRIYFYLGELGSDEHSGGKGGSSTIVAAADLTADTACISGCSQPNIVLIAGGGGGGGQASEDGVYAGGRGGDGGVAIASDSGAAEGSGSASAGNNNGDNSAGGGGGGSAGTAPNTTGGQLAQDGIGGYGGPAHIQNGASSPQGWSNQTPTRVGTDGEGGEGGHGAAAGGGGGGGYGGGGGGGASNSSSSQGTGGGGGGSYALESSQSSGSAPMSKPSNPSSNGTLQIVYQNIARTPLTTPLATATGATHTPTAAASSPTATVTPPPTAGAATATATTAYFGDNPDILNGQRVLADVVDLIVVNPLTSGGQTTVQNLVLETSDGGISGTQFTSSPATAPCAAPSTPFASPFPQQTRAGRLFNVVEDVIVTLAPSAGTACGDVQDLVFYVNDQLVSSNSSATGAGAQSVLDLMTTVADFNLDGYDDVLVLNDLNAFAATASDPDTPSAGLAVGPSAVLPDSVRAPLAEPAIGDFNGDGLIDVAWIGGDYNGGRTATSVYFATVCPGPVTNTICAGQAAFTVLVAPLAAQPIALPTPDTNCGGFQGSAIASGNFSGDVSVGIPNQLLTVTVDDSCLPSATLYGFDGDMVPTALTAATELPPASGVTMQVGTVYAASAVFDVLSAATQAVVAYGGPATASDGTVSTAQSVAIVRYDGVSTLSAAAASSTSETLAPLAGLAVGVFGAPPTTDATTQDFTPSIAVLLGNDCTGAQPSVQVYSVDGDTLVPVYASQVTLSGAATPSTIGYVNLAGSLLQAGDLQGDSIRVGQPVLLDVTTSTQPYIVLAAPPMHVDYVSLDGGDADVVNFSVLPGNYFAQYDTQVTGSNQSSSQATTSYGHAIDLSATEQVGYTFVPAFGASATLTQSVQLTYDRTTSQQYDTFAQVDFDASTQTVFDDQVWYTEQSYTIYNYPVIGQTSCPSDTSAGSTCDPDYPLYITLSGPTVNTQVTAQGSALEWYQPVQEIGQVFSYPPNETLLAERLTDPSGPLSSAVSFDTDTSSSTQSVSWSVSQSDSLTTGSSSSYSVDTDNSITAGTPLYSIVEEGVQVTVSGDYSTTSAQSTLNAQTTTVGASGGIAIVKSGQFLNPSLYAYQVEPFIFGQSEPVSPDQTIALDTDIQTSGTLQTAFAADPTMGTGTWWSGSTPYATYPDVALNHPARWSYAAETRTDPPSACLQQTTIASDGYICMTVNLPDADDLWDSEFYWMRGLLITVGGTSGPQRNSAVVGDDVYLQARVYNYSLTDMPAGTEVHVRFYMQQWDDLTKGTLGDAILINDSDTVLSGGIPAFNEETPNWTTVSTQFDTSDLDGDTLWIFWVVTWMEDSDGNLVSEVPGHGLTAVPGTLTSIGDVPIETVTVTLPDNTKEDDASFTNNVGFYNVEFALQSAASAAATAALPEPHAVRRATAASSADSVHLTLSRTTAAIGEKVKVSALVDTPQGLRDGAFIYFFDGDPTTGVQPFDVEIVPPAGAGRRRLARVPYRARTCGMHTITAVVSRGRANQASASVVLDVPCATATPTATPIPPPTTTPRRGADDDGCAIAPAAPRGAAVLILPAVLLLWRRRRHT